MRLLATTMIVAGLAFASPALAKTAKECRAEYTANRAQLRAQKVKEADYIRDCRVAPAGAPTQVKAAPAAPVPGQVAAPTAPAAPTPPVAPTAPGAATAAYPTEAQAKARCPGATVVWANTQSKVYHFAGHRDYGHTKQGAYMCEADAAAAGVRPAKNEKHP